MSQGSELVRDLSLLTRQCPALFEELGKQCILLGDAVGVALLVRGTGVGRGLFSQNADILAHRSNALFKFGELCWVGHETSVAHLSRSGLGHSTMVEGATWWVQRSPAFVWLHLSGDRRPGTVSYRSVLGR